MLPWSTEGFRYAGENTEDEYTTDSDDSDDGSALQDMTPEQVIRALRQEKRVRGPHGRLDQTTAIREMQMVMNHPLPSSPFHVCS